MDLHFTVDGHRFVADVSASPAIDEFLSGRDWLVKNEAKWDFAKGTISPGDRLIRSYRCTLNEVCRHILVSEDCVVPPKHEANILVKMLDDGIPHLTSNWAIEPHRLEPGVMEACTLSDSHKELAAHVCNY